ncbi:PRC-barrel domain-containing protein [Alcanivorax limicola]|uniref:PRC-barrel domain-containing protein n=1 Tax=Alcanivorax limicola TaxID=2874102 RepID=UPI001CBBF5DF|nr:PRC-barrel domain-containing protein [Alcanivorax limicola]
MKKLTALILSAAIVPALTLGTVAVANDGDNMKRQSDRQGSQQFMTSPPAGALYADDLIGANVKNRSSGDNIGDVDDLVIGRDGKIVGVVITTGTTLGMGGREVSLNWDQLQHAVEDDDSVFYVNIGEDALKSAPKHERK